MVVAKFIMASAGIRPDRERERERGSKTQISNFESAKNAKPLRENRKKKNAACVALIQPLISPNEKNRAVQI